MLSSWLWRLYDRLLDRFVNQQRFMMMFFIFNFGFDLFSLTDMFAVSLYRLWNKCFISLSLKFLSRYMVKLLLVLLLQAHCTGTKIGSRENNWWSKCAVQALWNCTAIPASGFISAILLIASMLERLMHHDGVNKKRHQRHHW